MTEHRTETLGDWDWDEEPAIQLPDPSAREHQQRVEPPRRESVEHDEPPAQSAREIAAQNEARVARLGARPEDTLPPVPRDEESQRRAQEREERDARILADSGVAEGEEAIMAAEPAVTVGERIARALEEMASALNAIAAAKY